METRYTPKVYHIFIYLQQGIMWMPNNRETIVSKEMIIYIIDSMFS